MTISDKQESHLQTTQRIVRIEGTLNFRDLGGYTAKDGRKVKWQKLYRSAQLDKLSQEGINNLAKLDIKSVIDLRFTEETELYPTIQAALPKAQFFTWDSEPSIGTDSKNASSEQANLIVKSWRESLDSNDPAQVKEAMRSNYPVKLYSHRAIYRRMLLQLINDDTPLLFHCAAGKDRTGVAAALILSLLGVSDDQIIADYLLTQELLGDEFETWLAGGAKTSGNDYQNFNNKLASQPKHMLEPVFAADRSYIETLLNYVASTYDGFQNYTTEVLGINADQIKQLQSQLLT